MDNGPPTRPLLSTPGVSAGMLLAGRYRLEQVIGRGGMAEVFAAHDELLHRRVAIKVFPPGTASAPSDGSSEMRLLASLSHPGLVTVHDAGATAPDQDAPAFLVMELVSGPTLSQQLNHGPLRPDEVRQLGAQVAAALAYVHGRGLVHRDVKPGNILLTAPLTEPGTPVVAKLADFGIARMVDATRATLPGTALGTAPYLSPEQVQGAPVGPATDVYALGLTLLEALTAVVTYPGTAMESAVARLHRAPDLPAGLDHDLAALLTSMTALDPAGRPGAGEVADALAEHPRHDTRPVPVAPMRRADVKRDTATTVYASPWRRWTALAQRTRLAVLAAVAAVAVAALAALLLVHPSKSASSPSTPPASPHYPQVVGTVGTDLHRLQKAVQP